MAVFSVLGLVIILIILWDAFETIILPRRVSRRIRLARIFYRTIWRFWTKRASHIKNTAEKESYLGYFGPLSLILLLTFWAIGLVIGYALINFGLSIPLTGIDGKWDFPGYLFASGAKFLPLDFSDIVPTTAVGRISFIIEAATGFGFFAALITYLPVIYQVFSRREVNINLLDPRAGSPPSAVHLLKQYSGENIKSSLIPLFETWEIWCAELLESHLSYPVLAYYRSQHDNESWISALLMILDASALVLVGVNGIPPDKAKFTFSMARHAVIDLTQNFFLTPQNPPHDRLSEEDFQKMVSMLQQHRVYLNKGKAAEQKLKELRHSYEPYIQALSNFFLMPIPPFLPTAETKQQD